MSDYLYNVASVFDKLTNNLLKLAYIRKVKDGWRVFSEKGKNLGTYKSEKEAKNRLRQIEFFKHKKAANKNPQISLSHIMRELNKQDKNLAFDFLKNFYLKFEQHLADNSSSPGEDALLEFTTNNLEKSAEAIDLGDPETAGKALSDFVKFVMKRVPYTKTNPFMRILKKKILSLDEEDIATKNLPDSAPIGQCITFLKHILIDHDPTYIRETLNNIVRNL